MTNLSLLHLGLERSGIPPPDDPVGKRLERVEAKDHVDPEDIPDLIFWWRKVLNLRSWRIEHEIVQETTMPKALMEVVPTRLRRIAKVRIRSATLELTPEEFQALLVHELCHLLTDNIAEEHSLQMEFTDDEFRRRENKARFIRELEKCVEATAQLITKTVPHHERTLEEINHILYRFMPEEEFTDPARLFTDILEFSADAISVITLDGRVAAWNPAIERLFGWEKKEILGRPISLVIPRDHRHPVDLWNAEIDKDPDLEYIQYTVERYRKDGSKIWVAFRLFPICDMEGRTVGLVCIGRGLQTETVEEAATAVLSLPEDGTEIRPPQRQINS